MSKFRKFKKSSIALMLVFLLMGSSISVHAAVTFFGNLNLPIEEYSLSTETRDQKNTFFATLRITSCTCTETATTYFKVMDANRNIQASSGGVYIQSNDKTQHSIMYNSEYLTTLCDMKLVGKTASSHTGYALYGKWDPNGNYG